MNSIGAFSTSAHSSAPPSVTDLDGYTLREPMFNSYGPPEDDEFGFDPPEQKPMFPKHDHTYSPPEPNDLSLGGWPGFEREEDLKQPQHAYEIDKLITQSLPNAANAISRYGQVTPPRTNSTDSGLATGPNSASASPKSTAAPERRKRSSKVQAKDSTLPAATTTSSGRKRKNTRKASMNAELVQNPDDAKRKASLEKNRLAAAKCRVNKKEKTEQLQRDSHEKAVHNAFLKDQVMHMKEEIQQMNAILLAHANCKGCKSPDEIQKHLSHLSTDFVATQMPTGMAQQSYSEYPQMSLDDMPSISQPTMMGDSYFGSLDPDHDPGMLHPPLPDFDRSADFEVHTPMQTD
jgi:hypothetical protein